MGEIIFNESLIIKLEKSTTNKEALSEIADVLYDKGYVKEGYKDAILKREEEFPTGILTRGINVAIPHTDVKFVNKASIAVGISEKPLRFYAMDEPEEQIDVYLIIMLALKEPHGHIEMLQKVINLIKDQKSINQIISAKDSKAVYETISKYLI